MRSTTLMLFSFLILSNLNSNVMFSQNLIAHYNFDNNAIDISGNNNNGIIIGDVKPTIDRFGNHCGALSFNGINSYIEVPNSKSLSSIKNKISVTCWFKIEKNKYFPLNKWITLICKGDEITESYNNPQFRVQLFQSDKQSTISVNTEFTEIDTNFNNHIIEYGKWYFYTLVYDGNLVKSYLNGNKIWTFPYSGVFNNNNMPLNIGRDVPGSVEFFYGSLDELRIYNGVLSDKDIINLYNDNTGSIFLEPFTLKCSDNISVITTEDNCFAKVNYKEPEFNINCGDATIKLIKGLPSGSNFPIGTTNIMYKVESSVERKKTCSFNISVKKNHPPEIKCSDDVKLTIHDSINSITYHYKSPLILDTCGIDNILLISGIKSGGNFPIGITENKFKVFDKYGNSSECSFTVTVSKVSLNVNSVSTNSIPNEINSSISSSTNENTLFKEYADTINQALNKEDRIIKEESNNSKTSINQLRIEKEKFEKENIKINDSLIQMQKKLDELISENSKLLEEKIKLNFLKNQQESEVLNIKFTVDSLNKLKQQIIIEDNKIKNNDLFNVPLKVGAVAKIKNIYFNADASFLKNSSYVELDKLVIFLQENNNLIIEIGGHTNGLCDDLFCIKLSTIRAKTCVDYLISKNISPDRLKYKGYGKSQLLNPLKPGDVLNQRVEIKIIGI